MNPESRLSDDWCLCASFAGVMVTSSGEVVELDELQESAARGVPAVLISLLEAD